MIKIKEVTGYETSDGKLFSNAADASKHQKAINFDQWYIENGQYENRGLDADEIREWLTEHREQVLKLLSDDEVV